MKQSKNFLLYAGAAMFMAVVLIAVVILALWPYFNIANVVNGNPDK